jgi:hypothetical protein
LARGRERHQSTQAGGERQHATENPMPHLMPRFENSESRHTRLKLRVGCLDVRSHDENDRGSRPYQNGPNTVNSKCH